jgi:REP-associated tyrosine transposase
MPNYRRAFVAGACWFFTHNLQDRRQALLVEKVDTLRRAFKETQKKYPFEIDAIVILPDHLHAVWTLPPDDSDFSTRWRLIKARFSRSLPKGENLSAVREARGERGIWQYRYWEHLIRNDADYARHVAYCYINPIKHGLVRRVQDWPHSSFHRDVQGGLFPLDWAGEVERKGRFGERK